MEQESSTGPVIATIIVVVLLVVGGYYLLKKPAQNPSEVIPVQQGTETASTSAQTSDSIDAVANDAASTDVSNLETGVNEIDATLAQ